MRTEQTIPSDFDSLSGIWRCRWVQYGRTALEELALQIQNGCVHGDGVDPDGMFAYTGSVHTDGTVSLTKVYIIQPDYQPSSASTRSMQVGVNGHLACG